MERHEYLPCPALEKPAEQEGGGCGCEHHEHETPCGGHEGCGRDSWGLNGYPLAMVYAPCQAFRGLYDSETALSRGTLFTELDLPLGCAEGAFTIRDCACGAERRGRL
jgi:hypothetical protein